MKSFYINRGQYTVNFKESLVVFIQMLGWVKKKVDCKKI